MIINNNEPRPFIVLLLLTLVCTLVFASSLNNGFLIDDHDHILNNIRFEDPKFILYEFIPALDPYQGPETNDLNPYYRPLARITPMLGYSLFGTNPLGHHMINLILFIFCCFSIFVLLKLLLQNWRLALLTSFFYAVHPLNSLFVNYITANVFAVQIIVMCWSIIFFERKKYPVSFLFFGIALLCHDTAIALPIYLICISFFLKNEKPQWKILSPFILTTAIIFSLRMKHHEYTFTIVEYINGLGHIFSWYLQKFFFLKGVVLIWATPLDGKDAFIYIPILLILFSTLYYCLSLRKKEPLIAWAVSWLTIGFGMTAFGSLYESSHGMLIEPHWLFFPSIGLFALFSHFLLELSTIIAKNINIVLISTCLILCILVTNSLNHIFADEKRYCQYWLNEAPTFEVPTSYLVSNYLREGNFIQAEKYLMQLTQDNDLTQLKWGYWELAQDHLQEAKAHFTAVLKSQPKAASVHYQMGIIYTIENDFATAEIHLQKALKLDPLLLEARIILSRIYLAQGRIREGAILLGDNLEILPNHGPTLEDIENLHLQNHES